MPLIDL